MGTARTRCELDEPVKISVITVVYNGAATVEDTILSVAAQTYPDVEHIVIDGGSTDGTVPIIEKHRDKLARVVSEPDQGIYDAMNKGIACATGDVVGTLNSDDVYADDRVLATVAEAFADPELDACYGDLVYVDRERTDRVVRYWTSRPYVPGLFERGWMPAHPTFYVRRRVYERYGSFDLEYKIQSDFELTMRLLRVHRIRSRYIPRIMVRMRMGGTTNKKLSNIVKGNLESYRACRKHGIAVTPLFFVKKIVSRLPQFVRRPPFPPEP
jgi:glycosyltransferase involved in cell wall biosynthesis